jgi:hypothetical protein
MDWIVVVNPRFWSSLFFFPGLENADALETGLDKLRNKRILPKRVFTALYTYGHRCAGEDENSTELASHHSRHISEYLT